MIFLLGGEGYVGSAYARLFAERGLEHSVINRTNYADHVGRACDVLVNANGNSKKFLADRDPKNEFDASVRSVAHALADFKSEFYIQLSSGDVYPDTRHPASSAEETAIGGRRQSRYGLHKFLAETLVRSSHPRWLVMRMGGFVGPGMKKNAIFDLLHDQTVWLTPSSELQFVGTDTAARLVWDLYEHGVVDETVNLGARGIVRIDELRTRIGSKSAYSPEARETRFEIAIDKLAGLSRLPVPESGTEVESFLAGIGR